MPNKNEQVIFERITKKSAISEIIPGSTPVISFGDFTRAQIATIGINPSTKEFLTGGKSPKLIVGKGKKRLEDFESLEINDYGQITSEKADAVWRGCQEYFQRNPYHWFSHFAPVLSAAGASYADGSATHLDLTQWATRPVWSSLSNETRSLLLSEDLDFFIWQNSQPNIKLRLINGRTVLNQVTDLDIFDLIEEEPLEIHTTTGINKCQMYQGTGSHGERVLGWSVNIQSMRGSNALKEAAAEKIGRWVANNR
jgi:hypothetical protein